MVGATDFLDEPVRICSTGQRRRLLLGQALLGGCPVLLLDEPFADLDAEGVDCVRRISQLWASSGGLVLAAGPSVDAVPEPSATLLLGAAT
jgi:heme exporter protein A